ncbi:MAG: UvrD-helicase domain-containing protein [Pseudomonadota bacterium]|nr:UvrD-helicase domain-containing protein [Pseudomonadota bacterium]
MASDALELDREARRRAVLPECSFIVQAPAGSGKTTLLTLRYLRLLADVERPEQIVAITFTRKAAAEMRHRIVTALALGAEPPAADADERTRELQQCAAAALARSRERGWGLEENPARLHVQTIDGLNHWLARRLPLAAGIGTAATLVDDARTLYAEAARRTVARLDEEAPVAAGLRRLARSLNHQPRQLTLLLEGMLGARELWLPKLMRGTSGPSLRPEIDRLLRRALESELAAISAAIAETDWQPLFAACRAAAAAGAPPSPVTAIAPFTALPAATAEFGACWRAIAELLLTADKEPALRKQVAAKQGFLAASEGAAWPPLKRAMKTVLESLAARDGLAPALARLRRLPPAALTDAQWERIEALTLVLPYAVAELLALFAERDSLDHPAVAAAAREALGDESAPTELALALDYRIRHLLVDEYQDTSPSQARLLELLVAGWQRGDGRSLFCVGDPMQSIYAFREADVTLFLQAQRQGIGGVELTAERLGRNFRSSAAIVDWVNTTFAALLPPADDFERGAVRYSPAAAVRPDEAGDGVRVHALLDADARALAAVVATVAGDAIATLVQPSIAILVRGRPSLPPILAALRDAGIEYRGVELESLLDRPAIRDLVALVAAMLHDGDRTAWLAILRAPWCGLPLSDLLRLTDGEKQALIRDRLRDTTVLSGDSATRAARLLATLDAAIAARGRQSLGSWLKSAWLALEGPATIGDGSDLANAELLFAALDRLELEAGCLPPVSAIEAAVAGVMASPVGSDSALVQVMTIHRAKGLEFDVVILPDLQRGPGGGKRPLLYWTTVATGPGERGIVLGSRTDSDENEGDADALERWMRDLGAAREALELGRLAYVAATRARRRLHLIGSARLKWTAQQPTLRRPRSASLLGFLWPVLSPHFEKALAELPVAAPDGRTSDDRPRLSAPPVRRLVTGFRAPLPEALTLAPMLRISGEPEGSIRPEFDWAGAIAQAVGQVVHSELQRIAESGITPDAGNLPTAYWRRQLRELGIDDAHLPAAIARVVDAVTAVGRSQLAAELLDPAALQAQSELALTAVIDGVLQSLRIDRTFIDRVGVRWVIDWKTSTHEGADREMFLDNELERYRSQLERYARVMRLVDPDRPQRVGLYFPLLDAWREI